MRRLALLVPCLLASGCGPQAQGGPPPATPMGMIPAPPTPPQLSSLALNVNEVSSLCPGAPLQLVVAGTTPQGHQLATPTSYRGGISMHEEHGLPWPRFRITASHGAVNGAAFYVPPTNAFALAESTMVEFRVDDLAQPGLSAVATVPVNFQCGAALAFRGQDGGDGASGSHGQPGQDGASLELSIGRLQSKAHGMLILVRVRGPQGMTYHLFAPGGGGLTIDLSGGKGGTGGKSATEEVVVRDQGDYTNRRTYSYSGPPGNGGAGGGGGTAVIRIDKHDRLLANVIRIVNPGGAGGPGGEKGFDRGGTGPNGTPGLAPQLYYEDPAQLFSDEIEQGFPIKRTK